MASETDMRRHTVLDPGTNSASTSSRQPTPRKSLGDLFLGPSPAAPMPARTRASVDGSYSGNSVGDTKDDNGSSSVDVRLPTVSASASALGSGEIKKPSQDPFDRPESPPMQEETNKHRRFSMLRFRNASDSQLSARLKQQQQAAEKAPPMPRPPAIITTAPAMDNTITQKKSRMKIPMRIRRSGEIARQEGNENGSTSNANNTNTKLTKVVSKQKDRRKTTDNVLDESQDQHQEAEPSKQSVVFQEPRPRPQTASSHPGPPAYGDEHGSALALPVNRLSESERSEGSSGDHGVYASTTTTTHTVSTTTTFFRLPRRKQKQPEPLFPLSHLPQRSKTPALPTVSNLSLAPNTTATPDLSRPSTGHDRATPNASASQGSPFLGKPHASTVTALFRPNSRHSGQSSPTRTHLNLRGRSSTLSSIGRNSVDDHQYPGTTRTSSSAGRKSFGDLLGLSRLRGPDARQGSLTPATPGSSTSKNNSLQLTRDKEPVILPERRDDDTPAKYLARLEEVLSRGVIASALSKGTDAFSASVLRSYMRSFSFFEEPMDMAIRKLLMEAELPKETQQIDRCLQAFANRYHECNPGIYSTPDQAYFVAFSLLILHTDVFNKNNKYKMQKTDYLKNTRGEGIYDDVLECFYDNITYTPFIHVEDDLDINGERIVSHKMKKKSSIFPNGTPEQLKRSKDPIDPYTLILDGKLDVLRPPLKDQIPLEEHYSYLGTAKSLNLKELQKTFFKTGVLQIVSARSRPDAFMSEKTVSNPQEAHPGIVDIKITKVGTLWRKDQKKKKTRSPWQEWGAILTGAQLYFFRNTAWVKNLMHQYESHIKQGHDGIPVIFKPPMEQFKPDALMSTDGAVALYDSTYRKHKNAFVYIRHGGFEEVLLAQSEEDRNDWLAKLNYAAAFRTSGVRMRGVVGGNYDGQSRRAIRRLDSSEVTQVIQTPTGEVSITRGRIDPKMAHDILTARREVMQQRIDEANEKLQAAQKHLETQRRNARHLLILAPIQDKTRDQVRGGAAKIIAQLKWSRTEIWRLKCHRDILMLDLDEEKEVNGELQDETAPRTNHNESRASSHKMQPPQSPAPLSSTTACGKHLDGESPVTEEFQTPPTSATAQSFHKEIAPLTLEHNRRPSVSSVGSSQEMSSPASGKERDTYGENGEEDAGERQVLEQAGLLEAELTRTPENRPTSSAMAPDETRADGHFPRTNVQAAADKDKADRNKMRRSLQRTLRESAGHLSHHRSHRKAKESVSSNNAQSDETIRDDILSRGTGSFTVHGKKASVINFGSELQNMQRKQSQTEDQMLLLSPTSADDDFHSVLSRGDNKERRESAASASTETARSFRDLHRKYRIASASAGLVVPSDDDSDIALSFSEGRRTPLPPLEDEADDSYLTATLPKHAHFFAPEPASSPVHDQDERDPTEVGGDEKKAAAADVDRLPSPPVTVSA